MSINIVAILILSLCACVTSDANIGKEVVFTCRYITDACKTCAHYKVTSTHDSQTIFLKNEDVYLTFNDAVPEEQVGLIISPVDGDLKVWGKVITRDGKDASSKKSYVIEANRVQLIK